MEFDKAVAELDALVETLEREGDERALLLLQLIDAIHRPGLERIAAGDTDHPIVQALLAMYDIAPLDDQIQVEEALDEVRPYIQSHGGEVELLDVAGGVVQLRLSGSCAGCAASAMTLKRGIEEALREHYPGFKEVLDRGDRGRPGPSAAADREPTEARLRRCRRRGGLGRGSWRRCDRRHRGPAGELRGRGLCVRDGCPVDGIPLDGGRLTADRAGLPVAQLRL